MIDLESVRKKGLLLEYVMDQTPEICLEAVKQCGLALRYVWLNRYEGDSLKGDSDFSLIDYQTICLEAIKQNGMALQFIGNQTEEMCLIAVKQNGRALEYVNEKTLEICLEAVKNPFHTTYGYKCLEMDDLRRLRYVEDKEMRDICRKYQEGKRFLPNCCDAHLFCLFIIIQR